jgi:soluble lytic murein transglycosylase-like protein
VLRQRQHDTGRVPGKTMPRSSLLTWLEIAPEVKALQPVLREAARETGVDAELLKAIIAVESGYRNDLKSPRGAIGLMQITPATADRYASKAERQAKPAEKRLLDPRHNVHIGARMLADLNRRYGGIDVALAAWNAGEGSVRRNGGKMPPFDETRAHVQLVLELYWALLQESQQARASDLSMPAVPGSP